MKYTLRGIEQYFPDLNTIFLVGDRPDFINNVVHIPFKDMPERHWKQRSIYNKLLYAAVDKRVSDSFVWFSDDHFLLKPFSPNYNYHSSLENAIANFTIHESYRRTIANTYNSIRSGMHYGHGPMVFRKDLFARSMAEVNWSLHWGYAIKSIYCYYNGCQGQQYCDLKFKEALPSIKILHLLNGRSYFSISNMVLDAEMVSVLEFLYPQKSVFEL